MTEENEKMKMIEGDETRICHDEMTTLTDADIDNRPRSAAGAVLHPANHGYNDEDIISAAGRLLSGDSPDEKEDSDKVKEGAKNIPKTRSAQRRDEDEKNSD